MDLKAFVSRSIIIVVEIQKINTWEKIVVFKTALLKIKTQFIRQDKAEKWKKENISWKLRKQSKIQK